MSVSSSGWCDESTAPHAPTSSSSASATLTPTSSGSTDGLPAISAESSAPEVVSPTSARPNPGEPPDVRPLCTSVYTQTSGRKWLSTEREPSTMRLAICADTFAPYATPRTRRTLPASTSETGESWRAFGTLSWTSPPPAGGAPRRPTERAAPSIPKWRSSGSATVRSTSTLVSSGPLVTPRSVIESGCFAKGARARSGCANQPMAREVPQSCERPAPPTMIPGR